MATVKAAGWGTLTAIRKSTDGSFEAGDAIEMTKDEITIGRFKDCDFAHTENKLLSGYHCKLIFDVNGGKKFLRDMSKNGTLVNNEKVKNETVELSDGSVIRCVHKKTDPDYDVTYLFKNLNASSARACETNLDADSTQEYENDTEDDIPDEAINVRKRQNELDTEEGTQGKFPRLDSTCRPKSSENEQSNLMKTNESENDQEVEENLTCGICQDIFHDCVSLQPCMHSFCAACYSQWMAQSQKCPSCRKAVQKVGKNHLLNNLVTAFLKKHPDRQRSQEELMQMNENDKIKGETIKVGNCAHYDHFTDENDSLTSEDYDDNVEDDDDDEIIVNFHGTPSSFSTLFNPFSRPADSRCRQCPNFSSQNTSSQGSNDASAGSFTCSLNQDHILCSCCNQFLPDRRSTVLSVQKSNSSCATNSSNHVNLDVQCSACGRFYCHLYWGCRKSGCLGCLNKFKDFNFGAACLSRILKNNEFESNVLKNYLAQKSIGVIELLRICVDKLENKQFIVPSRPGLSGMEIVCFSCGLRYFKELVYQYRSQIPNEELPNDVTRRESCYWGRNCRTQQHNGSHARMDIITFQVLLSCDM